MRIESPPDGSASRVVAIELLGVGKTYRTARSEPVLALTPADLTIQTGEFVSVVGPSGCGKTTLLKLVSGLVEPSQGMVRVSGREVAGPRPDIGIVFQSPQLLPWRTILANVTLPAEVQRRPKGESQERAMFLLKLVGLDGFENRHPHELSGGMQQRASICRALINDPDVLLMDEPFGALDAMTRERMNTELLDLWQETKKTILFITHSITEAVYLSDRVVVMTPRPGAIRDVLEIGAARPRHIGMLTSGELAPYTEKVRDYFNSAGEIE